MLGVLDVLEERKETRNAHNDASSGVSRASRHAGKSSGADERENDGLVRRGGCSHPDGRHSGQTPVATPEKEHKQRVATRHAAYKQRVTTAC